MPLLVPLLHEPPSSTLSLKLCGNRGLSASCGRNRLRSLRRGSISTHDYMMTLKAPRPETNQGIPRKPAMIAPVDAIIMVEVLTEEDIVGQVGEELRLSKAHN